MDSYNPPRVVSFELESTRSFILSSYSGLSQDGPFFLPALRAGSGEQFARTRDGGLDLLWGGPASVVAG